MAFEQENEKLILNDGRTLSYAIYGSDMPKRTVFYMHSYPSSRLEGRLLHSAAVKRNLRIIATDRPGIGQSTFQDNRRILNWPEDITELANHLKIHEFYVMGLSGCAAYALACVNSIGKERIKGAAIVSGLYPLSFGTGGMVLKRRLMFWVGFYWPWLPTFIMDQSMGAAARDKDPKVFEDFLGKLLSNRPRNDVVMLSPDNWPMIISMIRESLINSTEGAGWDNRLYGMDWGFELDKMDVGERGVPLTIWHGTLDINVPVTQAKKAHKLMPGSRLVVKEEYAHQDFIFKDVDEILGDLLKEDQIEEQLHLSK